MNYKIVNTCLILFALSAMTIAGIYAYKTFYYDPKNEWKIVSDENENVYVAKNRGEDICFLYTNTSNMIDGKWVKTHCDNN